MKLIAHRGLFNGPDRTLENKPSQILEALKQGFDCEVDLWVVNSEYCLGHDSPQYYVNKDFLNTIGLWIHAKNLAALRWLNETDHNYFWHQEDDFTLTSRNWIWTYPGKELTQQSVMVMPEWNDPEFVNLNLNCYGICSDFVSKIKSKL
jgi:hypothetical protein